jgi:hypothetical protein
MFRNLLKILLLELILVLILAFLLLAWIPVKIMVAGLLTILQR